jgi:hypothetical protein
MNTEILPPEPNGILIPLPTEDLKLPETALDSLRLAFNSFYVTAKKWETQAMAIKITSTNQKVDMKIAREIRLEIKRKRIEVENKRKELKDESLRRGRAIDGFAAIVFNAIAPIEAHLLEQEQFAARLEEQREDEIRAIRRAALVIYQPDAAQQSSGFDLAALSEEQFDSLLEGARLRFEQQQEAERLAEEKRQQDAAAEALRRAEVEKAAAAERQRIQEENARLAKEAAEARAKLEEERKAAAEAEAERLVEQKKKEAAEKEEREKCDLEARAEQARLKVAAEAAEAELAREREERRHKEEAERKEAARKEREAAKARRAPDKEKLRLYIQALRAVPYPELVTPVAQDIVDDFEGRMLEMLGWMEGRLKEL